MYQYTPPVVMEAPGMAAGGRLFGRVAYPRGVSVLVTGSTAVTQRWPTIEQQLAADVTFLGGHVYLVDDPMAKILNDAGLGAGLDPPYGTPGDRYSEDYPANY